jgi:hypothetical protein
VNLNFIMVFNKEVDDLIAQIDDICEQLDSCRKNGMDMTALVSELEDLLKKYTIMRKKYVNFGQLTKINSLH